MKTNNLTKEQLIKKVISIGFQVNDLNWIDYYIIGFSVLNTEDSYSLVFKSKDEALKAIKILKNKKDVFSIKSQQNSMMEFNIEDVHNLITSYQVSIDWLNKQRLSSEATA